MSLHFHTQNRQKQNRITVDIFDIVGHRNGSSASKQSRQGNLQRGGGASNDDTSACLAALESSVQALRSI